MRTCLSFFAMVAIGTSFLSCKDESGDTGDAGISDGGGDGSSETDAGTDTLPDQGNDLAGCAPLWSKRFGGTLADYGYRLAQDAAGNLLLIGNFQGTLSIGDNPLTSAGADDILVAKLDASGAVLWSKRFGGPGNDEGRAITADAAGNLLLTGYYEDSLSFGGEVLTSAGSWDVFLVKLDPDGAHLWSKSFGGNAIDRGSGVAVDGQDGAVWLSGAFQRTVTFGGDALTSAGSDDVYLAKFDAGGNHLWSTRFGAEGIDQGRALSLDHLGNLLLTGSFAKTVRLGGQDLVSAGGNDIFLVKLDASGNPLWSQRFGSEGTDTGNAITEDSAGNLLLTGWFTDSVNFGGEDLVGWGGFDIFVAKLDSGGGHLWSRWFGAVGTDNGTSIATDQDQNVLVAGSFEQAVSFGGWELCSAGQADLFIAKYDSAGTHLWSRRFGAAATDTTTSMAVTTGGELLLTGYFTGTVSFGGDPLESAGLEDLFVAKFGK